MTRSTMRGEEFQPCLVRPSIYLSSLKTEVYKDILDQYGITDILQVGVELQPTHPRNYRYLQLPVWDMPEQDIVGCFPAAFAFIDQALAADGKVLVHCQAGVSRSASVVIGYCMWKDRISADAATQAVTKARSIIWPNAGFKCQLREFELLSWDASKWTGWSMQKYLKYQYGDDSVGFMSSMLGGPPVDRLQQGMLQRPPAAVPVPSSSLKHAASAGSRAAAAAAAAAAVAAAAVTGSQVRAAAAAAPAAAAAAGDGSSSSGASSSSKSFKSSFSGSSSTSASSFGHPSSSRRRNREVKFSSIDQLSTSDPFAAAAAAGVSALEAQAAAYLHNRSRHSLQEQQTQHQRALAVPKPSRRSSTGSVRPSARLCEEAALLMAG